MVRKDSRISGAGAFVRMVVVLVWALMSGVLYSTTCLFISALSPRFSRVIARLWSIHLLMVGGVKVVVQGAEKLDKDKRYVFVANHQSNFDIPVLYVALQHQLSFLAKKELFVIPFFGWGMRAVGHIWIDRENARKALASIQRALQSLKKGGVSLVLFPEGTRSIDGTLGTFKQASFALVLKAGVEVVPVAIGNTAQILPKKSFRFRSGVATLTIGDPVTIDPTMSKAAVSALMRSAVAALLEKTEE